jgi:hypothetical protein
LTDIGLNWCVDVSKGVNVIVFEAKGKGKAIGNSEIIVHLIS